MATVIDSLVLEFGLDPKNFSKGQREVLAHLKMLEEGAVKTGKNVEAEGKKLGESFANMKRGLLAATAVFFAGKGIKEFVSYINTLDAAVSRTSHTMNMSARELSAWQGAAEQTGGSAESITGTLAAMSGEMNKMLLTGQASFLPVLNQLGISLFGANKQLKTSDQLLLDITESLEKFDDPARKTALLSMLPGMNPQTINMMLLGRTALEGYLDAARKAGTTTEESAAAAKKYQEQMALLERSSTNLGRSLMTFLSPAIVSVSESLTKLFTAWNAAPGSKEDKAAGQNIKSGMEKRFGDPRDFIEWLVGPKTAESLYGPKGGAGGFDEAGFTGVGTPKAAGIKVKTGAGAASARTSKMMEALAGLPGIEQVTSLNDAYHRLLGGSHPAGNAMDLTIKDPAQSAAMTAAIKARLAEAGISATVVNEYLNPSKNSTAPHIHVQLAPGAGFPVGGPAAAAAGATTTNRGGDTSNATTTMNIVINAPGGDPAVIEKSLRGAFGRSGIAAPANYGQQ